MPTQRLDRAIALAPSHKLPYVEPLSLVPGPEPFDDPEWVFEPKYDGFRGMLYLTGRAARYTHNAGTA